MNDDYQHHSGGNNNTKKTPENQHKVSNEHNKNKEVSSNEPKQNGDWLQNMRQKRSPRKPDQNNNDQKQSQSSPARDEGASYSNNIPSPAKNSPYKQNMAVPSDLKGLFQVPTHSTNIFDRSNQRSKKSRVRDSSQSKQEIVQKNNDQGDATGTSNQNRGRKNSSDEKQNQSNDRGSSQYRYKNVFSKDRSKSRQGSQKPTNLRGTDNARSPDSSLVKLSVDQLHPVRHQTEVAEGVISSDQNSYLLNNLNENQNKSTGKMVTPHSFDNDKLSAGTLGGGQESQQQSFNLHPVNRSPTKSINQTPSFSNYDQLHYQQQTYDSGSKPRKSARKLDPNEVNSRNQTPNRAPADPQKHQIENQQKELNFLAPQYYEKDLTRKSARKLDAWDIQQKQADLKQDHNKQESDLNLLMDDIQITSVLKSEENSLEIKNKGPSKNIISEENENSFQLNFDNLVRKDDDNTEFQRQIQKQQSPQYQDQQNSDQPKTNFVQQDRQRDNVLKNIQFDSNKNSVNSNEGENRDTLQLDEPIQNYTDQNGETAGQQQQIFREYLQNDLPAIKEEEERSYTISPAQYNKNEISNLVSYNAFKQYPFKITEMGFAAGSSSSIIATPFGGYDNQDMSLNLQDDTFIKGDRKFVRQDTSSPDGKFFTNLIFNELFTSNNSSYGGHFGKDIKENIASVFQEQQHQDQDRYITQQIQEPLELPQDKVDKVESPNNYEKIQHKEEVKMAVPTIIEPVQLKDQLDQEVKNWKARRSASPNYEAQNSKQKKSPDSDMKKASPNLIQKHSPSQQMDQQNSFKNASFKENSFKDNSFKNNKDLNISALDQQQEEIIALYMEEDVLENQLKLSLAAIINDIYRENQVIKNISLNMIDKIVGDNIMDVIQCAIREAEQAEADAKLMQRRTELMRQTKGLYDDESDNVSQNGRRTNFVYDNQISSPNNNSKEEFKDQTTSDITRRKSPFSNREPSESKIDKHAKNTSIKDQSKDSFDMYLQPTHTNLPPSGKHHNNNSINKSGDKQHINHQNAHGSNSNSNSFMGGNALGDKSCTSAIQEAPAFNILPRKTTQDNILLNKQKSEKIQKRHQPKNSFQFPANHNISNIDSNNMLPQRESEMSQFKLESTLDNYKSNIEDEDADIVISSDEDYQDLKESVVNVNQIKASRGMKAINAVQKYGVRSFDHHFNSEKLGQDESPFIYLSANPQFIDVLCVTCYECVKFQDVDSHSLACNGLKNSVEEEPLDPYAFNFEKNMKKLVRKEKLLTEVSKDQQVEDDYNERIFKLRKSIKDRLVEIQLEDSSNILLDHYSNLHAIAQKIYENNQDLNSLLIMAKIIEEFIEKIQVLQKQSKLANERLISLFVFSRRLIHLNNEKYCQLAKMSMKSNNLLDSFGSNNNDWDRNTEINQNYNQGDNQARFNTKSEFKKRRPYHVISDIKSEIESERYPDNQSDYSDISSVSNNIFQNSASNRFASFRSNKGSDFKHSPHSSRSHRNVNTQSRPKITVTYNNANQDMRDMSHSPVLNIPGTASPMSTYSKNMMFSPDMKDQRSTTVSNRSQKQQQDSDTDMKRYFFSLVIIKLNAVGGRMPKGLNFALLYNMAKEQNVEVDDWSNFIKQKLMEANQQSSQGGAEKIQLRNQSYKQQNHGQ